MSFSHLAFEQAVFAFLYSHDGVGLSDARMLMLIPDHRFDLE